ncbi:MAG: RNA polymerase sigma factor [Candidatus Jorgensenbacteria bacterium]
MFTNAIADEQLVEWYFHGNETALRTLFERYAGPVFNFLYRLLGNAADAEDVAQETFFRAWKYLKKFNREKRFKPWLFAIAKNAAFASLARVRARTFSDVEEKEGSFAETINDPAPLPEEWFSRGDAEREVTRALQRISPASRAVLVLYYQEDLSFREIGELLKEPLDTVKSRHRRALIALRDLLVHQNGASGDSNR